MAKCGCAPKFTDAEPYDTALATAILLSIEENMILLNNSANKPVTVKYVTASSMFYVNMILTTSRSSVKQALRVLKKSLTAKTVKRALEIYMRANADIKIGKRVVQEEISSRINRPL
jgi:hypothetical protein